MEHVFREADRQATGYGRLVAGASLLLVLVVIVVAVILVVGHYS